MSYLQHGHVKQSFYERSSKSYLNTADRSYLTSDNQTFLKPPTETHLLRSSDSFLTNTNTSYLDSSNSTFAINTTESHVESTNDSFLENSNTSYLDSVAPLVNKYLVTDNVHHVVEDNACHLDEDKENHLEESGGETSDDEKEDFSHTIDWSLIVPPFISPIFDNGMTKYKCGLTNKIFNSMPIIPERFDIFDFDKEELIITISRYNMKDGKLKYRELKNEKDNFHETELQSQALEILRVWKHKKEQELLGQINIENADYSDRRERMGVGDHSAEGAAQRKRRRELLKKQQQEERQKQIRLKQKLKQESNIKKQKEILVKQRMAQQRKQEKDNIVYNKMNQKQEEEYDRKMQRLREQEEKQMYIKIQSKNISQQRKQEKDEYILNTINAKRDKEIWKKQQRDKDLKEKSNYIKIESKNISYKRKQEISNQMIFGLEEKYNQQEEKRIERKDEHDIFMNNMTKSREDMRYNMQKQRNQRFAQQEAEKKRREKEMKQQRAIIDSENKRKEEERRKKMQVKNFVTKINNLLDVKSVGIDFDELPNEFFFKYNTNWDPKNIMGITDLDYILTSNGLQNTVEIIKSGMTKRAILRKHYQKIKIVSNNINDILTVLAISDNIDAAIRQLRQMLNKRDVEAKQEDRMKSYGGQSNYSVSNYSASNNWGLPNGYRVKKTAKGRLFFINDFTKVTSWNDPRPLQTEWRSGKTPQGRVFYINDNTKVTTWNDPRPKIYI